MSAVASFLSAYQPSPVICLDTPAFTGAGGAGTRLQSSTFKPGKPAIPSGGGTFRRTDVSPMTSVASRQRQPSLLAQRRARESLQHFREAWRWLPGHFRGHLSGIARMQCPHRQTMPALQAVMTGRHLLPEGREP